MNISKIWNKTLSLWGQSIKKVKPIENLHWALNRKGGIKDGEALNSM